MKPDARPKKICSNCKGESRNKNISLGGVIMFNRKNKKISEELSTIQKYVRDVSTAMFREHYKNECIKLFLTKIKEYSIKLTDDEKKIMRQAMFPEID